MLSLKQVKNSVIICSPYLVPSLSDILSFAEHKRGSFNEYPVVLIQYKLVVKFTWKIVTHGKFLFEMIWLAWWKCLLTL